MHGLDSRYVEPPRWSRGHEHRGLSRKLPRQHHLLEIAAGKLPRRHAGARRAHVVAIDDVAREVADATEAQQWPARHRRAAVRLEHDVRGDAQTRGHTRSEPVLRDVGDAGRDRLARIAAAETTAADRD